MRSVRRGAVLAAASLVCVVFVPVGVRAAEPSRAPAAPDVLVLHNGPAGSAPGVIDGDNILDLLGHFGLRGEVESTADYHRGDIGRHRFTFVLGDDDRAAPFPPEVLAEVRAATTRVMWIKRHLHELLADPEYESRLGFRMGPVVLRGYDAVEYRGITLTKNEPFLFDVQVKDPARVQVLATATRAGRDSKPYIVRSGTFWYVADSPFAFAAEGDRYWVFTDVLHDFFGIEHAEQHEALVRIEDVSVELDPQLLRDVADLLHDRGIPFQVSLIPVYGKPDEGREIELGDRPDFVDALHYMVSKGGTIVMHGTTHRFRGKSGDDYEFWDGLNGRPIPNDSRSLVEERLHRGFEQCLRNGIYPLAWETPHYMASQLDYAVIAEHFSCAYESVPSADREDSAHQFPYPSIDRFGRRIIPESLGYIDLEKPDVARMLENARRLKAIRDGVASFFFHPFLDRALLARIVDGLEAQGYEFTSVRDFGCDVRFPDMVVQSHEAPVELTLEDRYLHRLVVGADGAVASEAYSQKPVTGKVADAGLVPEGELLVMEGVFTPRTRGAANQQGWAERLSRFFEKRRARRAPEQRIVAQPRARVLFADGVPRSDWNDQRSFASALSAYGFAVSEEPVQEFPRTELERDTVLVVPAGAAQKLTSSQLERVQGFVKGGGRLVLDGPGGLASALGVVQEGTRPHEVHQVDDVLFGSETMAWSPPARVLRYRTPTPLAVYAQERGSELPMATAIPYGNGRVLYLAAPLDPTTALGYSRYPYFVHYVLSAFGLSLPVGRPELELYFDPGMANRQGADPGRLAQEWRKLGVRAIYAAAFHFFPSWSYDYARLIQACHENGILVYAWFELPHVSRKFWDEHPECHAKTATGEEKYASWRLPVDLDIPACQDLAFGFVEDLVRAYDWDGVNLAELNFDTNAGPEDPARYLPMGATTRQAFQALGGFDPARLFDPRSPYWWKSNPRALRKFEDYRAERVEAWHRGLLRRLVPIARERDLELVVTMLDSLHSPTVRRDTGIDSHAITALMDEFPFTLQVEDPERSWADSPARYARFGDTYRRLVRDRSRLMFDLNVVPVRDLTHSHAPTQRMTGIELAQSVLFARAASGRVAIYSEGSTAWEDLQLLSRVLAHDATVERRGDGFHVDSPAPVELGAPGAWQAYRVDGRVWPGWGERQVILPAGPHDLAPARKRPFRIVDTSALDFRLLRFAGGLETLTPTAHGLQLTYDDPSRAIALVNREPSEVRVDGRLLVEEPLRSGAAEWAVRLPRGRHTVDVVADSAATVIVQTTSLYSSTLIVIFGSVATGAMILLYMAILARRALRAMQRRPVAPPRP